MVDEDSHSIDLSVSGEKVHSTIYWLITFFVFLLRTKLFSNAITRQNCPKMLSNRTFVGQFLYFRITPKKVLVFLRNFLATFKQVFEKLRESLWKISSNLWKAL